MKHLKLVLAASSGIFVLTPLLILIFGFDAKHSRESAPGEISLRVENHLVPASPAYGSTAGPTQTPTEALEWGLPINLPPMPTNQEERPTRLYLIRVVDAASKEPISHAKVWVEIGDPPKDKRNGYTDSRGIFSFTWELTKTHPKTHVSVESPGYTTVDDFGPLIEDRLVQLTKAKPQ